MNYSQYPKELLEGLLEQYREDNGDYNNSLEKFYSIQYKMRKIKPEVVDITSSDFFHYLRQQPPYRHLHRTNIQVTANRYNDYSGD